MKNSQYIISKLKTILIVALFLFPIFFLRIKTTFAFSTYNIPTLTHLYQLENYNDDVGSNNLVNDQGAPTTVPALFNNGQQTSNNNNFKMSTSTSIADNISFWFKFTTAGQSNMILNMNGSGNSFCGLGVNEFFGNNNLQWSGFDSGISLNNTNWHNLIINFSNTKTYLDGSLLTNSVPPFYSGSCGGLSSLPFHFGYWTNNDNMKGIYDNIAIQQQPFTATDALNIWNGGIGAEVLFGNPPANLQFLYPITDTTTPDFSNFILSVSNVTSTDQYQIQVNWFFENLSGIYKNFSIANTGINYLNTGVSVPKPQINIQTATSQILLYKGFLIDLSMGTGTVVGETDEATTTVLPIGNTGNATTTFLFTYPQNIVGNISTLIHQTIGGPASIMAISSSSQTCSSGNTIGDGLCIAAQYLLGSSNNATDQLSTNWSTLMGTGPFAVIFGVESSIEGGLQNASSNNIEQDLIFGPTTLFGSQIITIPILTSSTLINIYTTTHCNTTCATTEKNVTIQYEAYIIWAMASIMAIKLIIL